MAASSDSSGSAASAPSFPTIGLEPLLIAFIATVIGGMRSLTGAVIGGFVLALIDTRLNYSLPQDLLKFRDAFTFSLVILILLVRPEGLMRGAGLPGSGREARDDPPPRHRRHPRRP